VPYSNHKDLPERSSRLLTTVHAPAQAGWSDYRRHLSGPVTVGDGWDIECNIIVRGTTCITLFFIPMSHRLCFAAGCVRLFSLPSQRQRVIYRSDRVMDKAQAWTWHRWLVTSNRRRRSVTPSLNLA